MIRKYFHRWEQELAAISQHERRVRPFEWGEDWIDDRPRIRNGSVATLDNGSAATNLRFVDGLGLGRARHEGHRRVLHARADALHLHEGPRHDARARRRRHADVSQRLHDAAPGKQHRGRALLSRRIRFASRSPAAPRRAVVVLAQWNSDADGHVGLCKILSRLGIASLRISLPYHDARMPPELTRADYIVSSNIVRTLQVCRQAVRDVRLALWWLRDQGYERLGLLGTSLGSCLSFLTDVPRAAGAGAGAQSRLAVLRRRGVARPVHRARARRGSTATSTSISCAICGARSVRGRSSIGCTTSRR